MAAYLCYSVFLAGFVYPVVAHSVWSNNGFLSITNVDPLFQVSNLNFLDWFPSLSPVPWLDDGLIDDMIDSLSLRLALPILLGLESCT